MFFSAAFYPSFSLSKCTSQKVARSTSINPNLTGKKLGEYVYYRYRWIDTWDCGRMYSETMLNHSPTLKSTWRAFAMINVTSYWRGQARSVIKSSKSSKSKQPCPSRDLSIRDRYKNIVLYGPLSYSIRPLPYAAWRRRDFDVSDWVPKWIKMYWKVGSLCRIWHCSASQRRFEPRIIPCCGENPYPWNLCNPWNP